MNKPPEGKREDRVTLEGDVDMIDATTNSDVESARPGRLRPGPTAAKLKWAQHAGSSEFLYSVASTTVSNKRKLRDTGAAKLG